MSKTVLNLDDKLVQRAKKLTGIKKKVHLVNAALQCLVRQKEIESIRRLRGKIHWEGNLEEMRRGRFDLG
jgi:Arc/MetJ family transcription regulator